MPLKEELLKLECTCCSTKCEREDVCNLSSIGVDKILCPRDVKQVLEVFYQHARKNGWCRYETTGLPHGGVSYPLTRKDFE